jgi:hypothetical protein
MNEFDDGFDSIFLVKEPGYYNDVFFEEPGVYAYNYGKKNLNYTITFSDNVEPMSIAYGAEYTLPEAKKEGYTFVKWLKNGEEFALEGTWSITENVELVAEFTINTYTISFDNDVESIEITYGTEYELPVLEVVGYTFNGWKNGEDVIEMTGTWLIAENVTLKAVLNAKTYTVSFDSNVESIQVVFGQEYTLPTATKFGFNFVKWLNGEEEFALEGTWELDGEVLSITSVRGGYTVVEEMQLKDGVITYSVPSQYDSLTGMTISMTIVLEK